MLKRLRITALLTFLIITQLGILTPVQACSGIGLMAFDEAVDWAEVGVIGHFVELDDVQLNGIYEVEQYLFGMTGPKYLLLALNSRYAIESERQGRFISGQCSFTSNKLHDSAVRSVVFLRRADNGSYNWVGLNSGYYPFTEVNGTTSVYIPNNGTDSAFMDYTEQELIAKIAERRQQAVASPSEDNAYPLFHPILLTLEGGGHALLPIDGQRPVLISDEQYLQEYSPYQCFETPCVIRSPNGLDRVRVLSREELLTDTEPIQYYFSLVGKGGVFSPTSDALAVWNENTIEIYTLFYPNRGYIYSGFPIQPLRVNFIGLANDGTSITPSIAWSFNGRMIAYSDAAGLWLWDALIPESKPRLLLAASEDAVPYARYFSPLGRYLAVTYGETRFNLDLVSGQQYRDGVISPDDRSLLAYDTAAQDNFRVDVEWFGVPLSVDGGWFSGVDEGASQVMWVDEISYLISKFSEGGCIDSECYPSGYYIAGVGISSLSMIPRGYGKQFDYESDTENLVGLIDDRFININGVDRDLANELDEAITHVEWLPSLMYFQ